MGTIHSFRIEAKLFDIRQETQNRSRSRKVGNMSASCTSVRTEFDGYQSALRNMLLERENLPFSALIVKRSRVCD